MTHSNSGQKRAVMLTPGKGGTGKTLFSRLLYYALVDAGIDVIGFDSDDENPEFSNYHKQKKYKVFKTDLLQDEGAHELLEAMENKQPSVVLMDMPAASGHQTRDRLNHFNLLDLSEDQSMPYRFTLVCVLDVGLRSVRSFPEVMEFCGDRAHYVAVRNQFWQQGGGSQGFAVWEQSETFQLFDSLKGIEIAMPALDRLTIQELAPDTNFFDAAKLRVGHRLITQSFLRRGVAELMYADNYLGLSSVPEQQPQMPPIESAVGAA
jgi:hypothetical protein